MTKERLKLRYVPLTIFILVMIPIITLVVLFNASLKEKEEYLKLIAEIKTKIEILKKI